MASMSEKLLLDQLIFRSLSPQDRSRILPFIRHGLLKPNECLLLQELKKSEIFFIIDGQVINEKNPEDIKTSGFIGLEKALGIEPKNAIYKAEQTTHYFAIPTKILYSLADNKNFRKSLVGEINQSGDNENTDTLKTDPAITSNKLRLNIGWLLTIVFPLGILVWDYFSQPEIAKNTIYLACIFSSVVTMWIFRLLQDFIPALFGILCLIILGIVPAHIALSGFSSSSTFLALGILSLGCVFASSGLSYRLFLIALKWGPENKIWYNFCLFVAGLILTPIISTANGRIVFLTPFLNDLLSALPEKQAKAEGPRLAASTVTGATFFSASFLTSKSINFLILGMLPVQDREIFQWAHWFYAASIFTLVSLILMVVLIVFLFKNDSHPSIPKRIISEQLSLVGPVSAQEWVASTALLFLVASIFTQKYHQIEIAWIVLTILFFLLMSNFLTVKDFNQKIDWAFVILLASLIGITESLYLLNIDKLLSGYLFPISSLLKNHFALFVVVLSLVIFVIRIALPINATSIILASLLIPIAVAQGVNAWLVGFIILALSEIFIWPYQASYYSQFVMEARAEGQLVSSKMFLFHALRLPVTIIAIMASIPLWQHLGML